MLEKLFPGGRGNIWDAGAEGKLAAAHFARTRRVPYFGICFGMQMAVIEAVRNLVGEPGAGSTASSLMERAATLATG